MNRTSLGSVTYAAMSCQDLENASVAEKDSAAWVGSLLKSFRGATNFGTATLWDDSNSMEAFRRRILENIVGIYLPKVLVFRFSSYYVLWVAYMRSPVYSLNMAPLGKGTTAVAIGELSCILKSLRVLSGPCFKGPKRPHGCFYKLGVPIVGCPETESPTIWEPARLLSYYVIEIIEPPPYTPQPKQGPHGLRLGLK